MSFDFTKQFQEGEGFAPSAREHLPKGGPYDVVIREIDGTGSSASGLPKIEVYATNDQGYIKDRLYISPKEFSVAKVAGLIDAAGIERPTSDDVDPADGRLSNAYLQRLVGKKVAVVVTEEADREDPAKMWPRVKGYRPSDGTVEPDVPIDTSGLGTTGSTVADDDIPF